MTNERRDEQEEETIATMRAGESDWVDNGE